jgi:hypothetical protein
VSLKSKFWKAVRLEVMVAGLLFCAGGVVAMVYVASWGGTPHFFQDLFGPAVMFAHGHGFVNPVDEEIPALHTFLHPPMHTGASPPVDAFGADALPESIPLQPWDMFQRRQMYLIAAVGFTWLLFGVSWSALAPLYGVLAGLSAAAFYGLFRAGMNRFFAIICTLVLIVSPVQLHYLVRLRDYSKTPFILGVMLLMALLLLRPVRRSVLLGAAALAGVLIGIGVGFRADVLVTIPRSFWWCSSLCRWRGKDGESGYG